MIEMLLIVLVLAGVAVYALKKKQKTKCIVFSSLTIGSLLLLVYMNYLMGL